MQRQVITVEEFKDGLRTLGGTVILTLRAKVVIKDRDMNKKHRDTKEPNPYFGGKCHKIVVVKGNLGSDYEDATRRLETKLTGEASEFKAGEHSWAEWVDKYFVYHPEKRTYYLRFIEEVRVVNKQGVMVKKKSPKKVYYFLNNDPNGGGVRQVPNFDFLKPYLGKPKDYSKELTPYRNYTLAGPKEHTQGAGLLAFRWGKRMYTIAPVE